MSRSSNRHPYYRIGHSDKPFKTQANRRLRHLNKVRVRRFLEPKDIREVSNIWNFSSEGMTFYAGNYNLEDRKALLRK